MALKLPQLLPYTGSIGCGALFGVRTMAGCNFPVQC
jgi:hypothetical protein